LNTIEQALEKQRLRLEAASQRIDLARHATGLQPLFAGADRVREGARWVGRHPEVLAGGVALLAAASPRTRKFIWRWGKRAFIGWSLWRDGDHFLNMPIHHQKA
jgi:hypothetical protein